MVTASKKGLKIGRALRSAARLPIRVSARRGSGRSSFIPIPGESPISILRVQILSCQDLVSKDRNGFSDPCARVALSAFIISVLTLLLPLCPPCCL
jgi:phosphatidylserine decarboxylase